MRKLLTAFLLACAGFSAQAQILPGILGGGRPSANTDPYFSSTKLLLCNDNAANGSSTFTDASAAAVTITTVGAPTYSNAQAPAGMTTSCSLSGTAQYFTVASSSTYAFGTGDVTAEAYIYNTNSAAQIYDTNAGGSAMTVFIGSNAGGRKVISPAGTTSSGITYSTWTHVAYSRCSGTSYNYIDGVSLASQAESRNYGTAILYIGVGSGLTNAFPGNLVGLRITGVCRYPGGTTFTPPTLPLPTS